MFGRGGDGEGVKRAKPLFSIVAVNGKHPLKNHETAIHTEIRKKYPSQIGNRKKVFAPREGEIGHLSISCTS